LRVLTDGFEASTNTTSLVVSFMQSPCSRTQGTVFGQSKRRGWVATIKRTGIAALFAHNNGHDARVKQV